MGEGTQDAGTVCPSRRSAPSGDLGGQRCARTVNFLLRDREHLAWTRPSPQPRALPSCPQDTEGEGRNARDFLFFRAAQNSLKQR